MKKIEKIQQSILTTTTAVAILLVGEVHAELTMGTSLQFNDNDGGNVRTVSVFPGNSFVTGWDFTGATERTIDLGEVLEYNFFNEEGNSDVIGSYASSGMRISLAETTDNSIANNTLVAEAVYTISDPVAGVPDHTSSTHVNGLGGEVTGSIDVTGLSFGTLFFIYGTNGANGRAINFIVTQGDASVSFAGSGSGFWENSDTISAVTPVSFTNSGTDNSISYTITQNNAGKFMGVVLSDTDSGPVESDPVITGVGVSGDDLILDFTGTDDVVYKVTESPDLSTPFAEVTPAVTGSTTDGIGRIVLVGGASGLRNFVRIEKN